MLDNKQQINRIILSLSVVIVYLIISFHLAYDTKFISDTVYYRKVFYNINENPMPYGIEFIVPVMMYIIHNLGFSFEFFLFFILMLWVPLIFVVANKIPDNISYFFIVLFFCSIYFIPNIILLIRQFVGCLFFTYYLFCRDRKIKYIFLLLSFTSHISLVIWWALSSVYLYDRIIKRKLLAILFVGIALSLSYIFFNILYQSVNFHSLSTILPSVIENKVRYYQINRNDYISVSDLSTILLLSLAFLAVNADVKSSFDKRLTSLVFFQCILFLLLKDNAVAATRFGMFSFYFSIPLIILYLNKYISFGSLQEYKNVISNYIRNEKETIN